MALDVVEFPEDIAWLDLSFNEITSISDDILEFPSVTDRNEKIESIYLGISKYHLNGYKTFV